MNNVFIKRSVNYVAKKAQSFLINKGLLTKKAGVKVGKMLGNVPVEEEVALYFSGNKGNLYQIQQWLGPLAELRKEKTFIFIVRTQVAFDWISKNTDFKVIYCRTLNDVTETLEQECFKCVIYVNNANQNFQALITRNVFHVHVNHGESDKISTVSNQSKAYDYVFIVGDAGYDKYNNNLINKDMSRFIQIGRPQLEHIEKIDAPITTLPKPVNVKESEIISSKQENIERKVIIYAPTWEATHEAMNYTSLGEHGLKIVNAIMNDPSLYLIYKPHPNTGSRTAEIKRINEEIIEKLTDYYKGQVILEGDINSLYEHVDLAIFDNSAVAIDYLATNKPMFMTDMFPEDERNDKPIITDATTLIDSNNVDSIIELINKEIVEDNTQSKREKVKHYYLGNVDYENKESTKNFINTIKMICDERDKALEALANSQTDSYHS